MLALLVLQVEKYFGSLVAMQDKNSLHFYSSSDLQVQKDVGLLEAEKTYLKWTAELQVGQLIIKEGLFVV